MGEHGAAEEGVRDGGGASAPTEVDASRSIHDHSVRNTSALLQSMTSVDSNDVQCREKWSTLLDPSISGDPFTANEDKGLVLLVSLVGTDQWTFVSRWFRGRTDAQLRRRYLQLEKEKIFPSTTASRER